MPSTMMHLMLAHKINPNGCGVYFMGSFAPDVIDKNRDDIYVAKIKNHLNFRGVPNREAVLSEFYSQIDKGDPFHMGCFIHLFCDISCNDEIFAMHGGREKAMQEYRIVGIWIRRNMPWVDDVFEKMRVCSDDFNNPLPDPWNKEIINYKNGLVSPGLRRSDMEADGNPAKVLTPEVLGSYSEQIAERYKLWIREHNRTA